MVNLTPLAAVLSTTILCAAVEVESVTPDILNDDTLRLVAIAGALAGGFMAVAFRAGGHKNDRVGLRDDALKWLSASVFGGAFSPAVCEFGLPKLGLPVTTSTVLATSSLLGLCAFTLVPVVARWFQDKFHSPK